MIAHITGTVTEKYAGAIVLDVHGVGYEIQVAAGEYDAAVLKDTLTLHTYHHIREQAQELYGFSSLVGKKLFELLITVQGVGPKAALAILSLADTEMVRSAIASADSVFIAKASGVGKKTAERVTVDLSDKVGAPTQLPSAQVQSTLATDDDALEALMALGYNLADATAALSSVDSNLPTAQRIREALKA